MRQPHRHRRNLIAWGLTSLLVTTPAWADHVHIGLRWAGRSAEETCAQVSYGLEQYVGQGPRAKELAKIHQPDRLDYTPVVGHDTFIVDPSLGFTADDIQEGFAFGNGVTVGLLPLKSGIRVACQWVVVQDPCPCLTNPVAFAEVLHGKRQAVVPPPPKTLEERLAALEAKGKMP